MGVDDNGRIVIGRFRLGLPYGGDPAMISIHLDDGEGGEGGDFSIADLEACIAAFYEEHF